MRGSDFSLLFIPLAFLVQYSSNNMITARGSTVNQHSSISSFQHRPLKSCMKRDKSVLQCDSQKDSVWCMLVLLQLFGVLKVIKHYALMCKTVIFTKLIFLPVFDFKGQGEGSLCITQEHRHAKIQKKCANEDILARVSRGNSGLLIALGNLLTNPTQHQSEKDAIFHSWEKQDVIPMSPAAAARGG